MNNPALSLQLHTQKSLHRRIKLVWTGEEEKRGERGKVRGQDLMRRGAKERKKKYETKKNSDVTKCGYGEENKEEEVNHAGGVRRRRRDEKRK